MKKKIGILLTTALLAATLSACSGSDSGSTASTGTAQDTGSAQTTESAGGAEASGETYTFETEFTYMEDVVGGGISGAAAGLNMIVESADASGGFYVGSTHSEKCVITFKITADAGELCDLRQRQRDQL